MGGQINMELKGYINRMLNLLNDLDLGFSREHFEIAIFQEWMSLIDLYHWEMNKKWM